MLDAALGVLTTVGVTLWRGPGWYLLLTVAICFLTFGIWGIVDRELGEMTGSASRRTRTILRTMRVAAACIGAVAAIVLMFSVLGIALGRIQS